MMADLEREFQEQLQNFKKLEKVGEGVYGIVYKALNSTTNDIVAMKSIRLEGETNGLPCSAIREISLLRELSHPNIVRLLDILLGKDKLYLVFEFLWMDLGNYLELIAPRLMDPKLTKSYLKQINEAILYCHQRRILHRDLKPQNLLISENGTIKVADLGLGRAFSIPARVYTQAVVTLWYRAPEILLGAALYSCPIDIWSLGCIFAEMMTGQVLFQGDSEIDQLHKIFIVLRTPTEEIWTGVSDLPNYQPLFPKWNTNVLREKVACMCDESHDLLSQMLVYNPSDRISAKKIREHPYLSSVDQNAKPTIV